MAADGADDESETIEKIELLGGSVKRDSKLPGHPVVAVALLPNQRFTEKYLHLLKNFGELRALGLNSQFLVPAKTELPPGRTRILITDEGMKMVGQLRTLEILDIRNAPFSDAGLTELGDLKRLRMLALTDCGQITDAGLLNLQELRRLQSLYLIGCKQIGDAGVQKLRDAAPNLRIVYLH